MDEDKRDELMKPVLDRIPPGWGTYLSYDEGWDTLVLELDGKLAELDPGYQIQQVKEKFGGLRFYASASEDISPENSQKFQDLIDGAEREASAVCEWCGTKDETVKNRNDHSWLKTLCGADAEKREKMRAAAWKK